MRLYKLFAILVICVLILGLAAVAQADDPPKGSSETVPIQAGERVLDPATASITHMELAQDNKSLVPVARPPAPTPIVKGNDNPFAPAPMTLAEFDGKNFITVPNSAAAANDLLLGSAAPGALNEDISAAGATVIKSENFEGAFPNDWTLLDNNGPTGGQHFWGDVNCFPIESSGAWSGWPASRGANGVNPCAPNNYPNNIDSWLIYGPFSLSDAKSASFDFFFRMVSEAGFDQLFWGYSTNGTNYFGQFASGTHTSGLFNNGYNFASLDLSHLAGQPQVWIAITFDSDSSVTFQGPFIDAISLRKNTQAAREFITQENFDVDPFPNASWVSFDDNGSSFIWDDVACFSRSGSWSMWAGAIDWPVTGPNPCPGSLNNYPVNTELWLMYGPFSLNAANEAWVDFYFRNESEAGFDFLFWGASTNSTDFFGSQLSGTYIQGPHGNGYNFIRFDLKSVPTLGDLRGRNAVWFAFVFASDNIITSRGAFIDDVNIVVERNKTFLPVVQRPVPPPPSGTLTFENHTGNPI
ncbi:MAG TPA: choice-of-anchor J domain-containing protein, partial [Anaerolineae bacterium]|nr:choice-of-anchor J domain-containing protein [Anaerolineae bacterium]